jgi:hypothetical protein
MVTSDSDVCPLGKLKTSPHAATPPAYVLMSNTDTQPPTLFGKTRNINQPLSPPGFEAAGTYDE